MTPDRFVDPVAAEMQRTYDRYFSSDGYRQRYPQPNATTLEFLLDNGARSAAQILDFGCGNGRYALALLAESNAHVTAFDISAASLTEFADALKRTPYSDRVAFVHDDLSALGQPASYDLILMLFGVLSHLGDRAARVRTLSALHRLLRNDGRLILSVPSIYRRRPWELLKAALARRFGRAKPQQDEAGNIHFTRQVKGDSLTFFYHLYTPRDLRADLAAAGFAIERCEAESMLPEWWVTQSRVLRGLDRIVSRGITPALGYGIRVLARPA